MDTEEFKQLKSLAKSPELFEKKRQHLLDNFIASVINKEGQRRLRAIQKELDSSRDQTDFQIDLAKKMLQQVTLKSRFLKEAMSDHSGPQADPTQISFSNRRE